MTILLLAVVLRIAIVDGRDRPLADAEVAHTAKRIRFPKTGADGVAEVKTDAPRVVVRKAGFRSVIVDVAGAKPELRVKLERAAAAGRCHLEGTRHAGWPAGLRHVAGPNAGSFQPANEMVWSAATYAEASMELNGAMAIDARATFADGRRWRYVGNLAETVSYEAGDAQTAKQFDDLIAQACQTHVTAKVDDGDGGLLDGVYVYGESRPRGKRYAEVPADGVYEADTTSSFLVFRRFGRQAVVSKPGRDLRIALRPAAQAPFPNCLPSWETGPSQRLKLPEGKGSRPFSDVDYSGATHVVETATGKHYLRHGMGVNWSDGLPDTQDVSSSREYEERTYLLGELPLTDARGVLADGTRWRQLGLFGETASYATQDAAAAREFDALLDAVCLITRR